MSIASSLRRGTLAGALLLGLTGAAQAQLEGLPRRQPEAAIKHQIRAEVVWSALGFGDGRREVYEGKVAFHKPGVDGDKDTKEFDKDFEVVTDIWLRDRDGRMLEPATDLRFHIDKTGAPSGGAESLSTLDAAGDAMHRLVASSDLCLLPLRMLFRHEMPTGRGGSAELDATGDGFRVHFEERFAGIETISFTAAQRFESRLERTFEPSGYRLIDYILTFEDERDDTILAGFAIRMLVCPPDRARDFPGGVAHIAFLRSYQLDWLKESPIFPAEIWQSHLDKWYGRLADQLFDAIDEEALGDPDDSPSALALRALRVLDMRSLGRIVGRGSGRSLSVIAPQIVENGLPFDPAPFVAALADANDPRVRLRLATAAAAAGVVDDSISRAARVGAASRDPRVQRDALRLARALRDPDLASSVASAIRASNDDEVIIDGLLALGATGGDAALAGITAIAGAPSSDRVKAAAFRALADTGDPAAFDLLDDSNARAGAISPETGRFEMWIDRPDHATEALRDLHRFAAAVREQEVVTVMAWLAGALRDEDTNKPEKIFRLDVAREWLPRLSSLVPALAMSLEDHPNQREARLIVRSSGRERVGEILADLARAQSKEDKMMLARLVGCTGDPRARAVLVKMQDSDDLADFEAGAEGLDIMEQEIR